MEFPDWWWGMWIPRIEAAAKENELLEIDIWKEEWERLKKKNLASLKKRLSKNAAARLRLIHGDAKNPHRYFLQVVRYGRCH